MYLYMKSPATTLVNFLNSFEYHSLNKEVFSSFEKLHIFLYSDWMNDCKKLPDKCSNFFPFRTFLSIHSQSLWIFKKVQFVTFFRRPTFHEFYNKEKISLFPSFSLFCCSCGLQLWIEFSEAEMDVGTEEKTHLY